MNFVFRSKVNAILVLRDFIWNLNSANDRGFISPATRNVSESVTSSSEE